MIFEVRYNGNVNGDFKADAAQEIEKLQKGKTYKVKSFSYSDDKSKAFYCICGMKSKYPMDWFENLKPTRVATTNKSNIPKFGGRFTGFYILNEDGSTTKVIHPNKVINLVMLAPCFYRVETAKFVYLLNVQ